MKDVFETVGFISNLFFQRGLHRDSRFYTDGITGDKVPIPWEVDGEVNMELVGYAADMLGMTAQDILERNSERLTRWVRKYPLIKEWGRLMKTIRSRQLKYQTAEERMLAAIGGVTDDKLFAPRHDVEDLRRRTWECLRSADQVEPGTIHPGAVIENFHVRTEYVSREPGIAILLDSFFKMVERGKELFLKAVWQELTEDEICEYNIIVTYTGFQDRYFNLHGLYYRYVQMFRPEYQAEQGQDFFDYVRLDRCLYFRPWEHAEIIGDRSRMEGYISLVPGAKQLMEEFALEGTRFECSFTWSDARKASEEERLKIQSLYSAISVGLDEDYEGKLPTVVYIPKNQEDMGADGPYLEMLSAMAAPERSGGIPLPAHGLPEQEAERDDSIRKMLKRSKIVNEHRVMKS